MPVLVAADLLLRYPFCSFESGFGLLPLGKHPSRVIGKNVWMET